MSAASLPRKVVDDEEFDRRMQVNESKAGADPLAELARLVSGAQKNGVDPLAAIFSDHVTKQSASGPAASAASKPYELRPGEQRSADPYNGDPSSGEMDYEPHSYDRLAREQPYAPAAPHGYASHEDGAPYDLDETFDNWSEDDYAAAPPAPAPKRSKKLLYATAAVIAAGCFGIAGAWSLRSGQDRNGETPTIRASTEPVKTLPVQTQNNDAPGADTALLDKNVQTPAVRGVLSHDEKPIDVEQAFRNVRNVPGPTASSANTIPSQVDPSPSANIAAGQNTEGFPERKIVKTLSVTPEGALVRPEVKPIAPKPPAAPVANASPGADKPATPKAAAPKSAARVATAPKADEQKTEPTRTAALQKPALKPKAPPPPAQDGEQDSGAQEAETPEPAAAAASAGGGYALQLAAAGSEDEARATASRLGQKFSAALGGRKPSFFKAHDKNVYRVRVSGMSHDGAVAACEKVKAAGGGCFVAKN